MKTKTKKRLAELNERLAKAEGYARRAIEFDVQLGIYPNIALPRAVAYERSKIKASFYAEIDRQEKRDAFIKRSNLKLQEFERLMMLKTGDEKQRAFHVVKDFVVQRRVKCRRRFQSRCVRV